MTEKELRQKVVDTASAWLGTREYSAKHQEMLDIYNAQRPLPRGTRMLSTWPWCAAFVSTVSLQCNLRDIMPTECGCPSMIRLYQELGRWIEDDAYVPSPADVVFYDWQDSATNYATTDNIGHPDHVGIVLDCDGKNMTIIEGNNANAVNKRVLAVNDRFIRGYGCPDYASKADGAEPQPEPAPTPAPEPTPQPEPEKPAEETTVDPFITAKAREVINGKWGNGQARKDALAAWFVKAVQDEVNRLLA